MAAILSLVVVATMMGCQQDRPATTTPMTAAPDVEDSLDPEAVVAQMTSFMSAHETFAFEAKVSYESLQESGQKLHFDLMQHVAVSQPDRLFWVTVEDDARIDSAWFNAGTFSMIKQPDNIYGQIDVPATIPEMIDVLAKDYGLVVPFSDLLSGGEVPVLLRDLEASDYIGLAWVEGKWSHHVAMRNEIVDYEVWIQAEGDPVPLKVTITWKLEEGLPAFVARFKTWDFSPGFAEGFFDFGERTETERIAIVPIQVDEEVAP